MNKKVKLITLISLGVLMVILLGIYSVPKLLDSGKTAAAQSTEIIAQTKLPSPQPKLDSFIPISEQYQESVHSTALNTLLEEMKKPDHHVQPRCFQCHSYEYAMAPMDGKPAVAQLNSSIGCADCHKIDNLGAYTLKDENVTELCSSCHTGMSSGTVKPGGSWHHPHGEMFKGIGAIGLPEMPDGRYKEGISCAECHMTNQNHTFEATLPSKAMEEKRITSCNLCHANEDEQEFAERIDKLQEDFKAQDEQYMNRLASVNEALAKNKDNPDYSEANNLYGRLFTNLTLIEADASWGIHNLNYTKAIMADVEANLPRLEEMIK
ncbi:ammonia-forming cytochrome c nitrite reductase subunit c552 [Desulfosporosinus youngiae]|uniref:Cytochrome c552 n=1 Tax=Desulfosporosinus youngiae DSM 17734 TaxID=768710 RepID=H5Y5P4_9FIRM|nr:ammonia-forming cytochrome c nitrite reductase subunit c552 [Desulfosporosinus youngiae]EHQ90770.1 Cytochrome c552 [Desulfosporosinus youngiae DSM 17734]